MSAPLASRRRRPAPLSIRLSEAERKALETRAGGLPLSTYVKQTIFALGAPAKRRIPRAASVDRELAAQLLATLGASRLASNLAQIAKHANQGSLHFDDLTKADLRGACGDIRDMRGRLMRALGKDADSPARSISPDFELAATPQESDQ